MSGRDKIDAALELLKDRGVKPMNAAPLLWKLLWRLGLFVPPPHFLGFAPLVLLAGLPFGAIMGGAGLVFMLVTGTPILWPAAVMGLGGGGVFGLLFAGHSLWPAGRLGLPPWAEFDPAGPDADDAW